MTLTPLLNAPAPIQMHAFAALAAVALTVVQLAGRKGTPAHRVVGAAWAVLMLAVAISSFWIHTIRQFGDFSLIHLLSILTMVSVPAAVWAAHTHDVQRHKMIMLSLVAFALVGAGLFTLVPGRIMNHVVFG